MVAFGDDISVWIQVDGVPLPEYGVQYSANGRDVICWIPSEAGKEFEIWYRNTSRRVHTSLNPTVDGLKTNGKILMSLLESPYTANEVRKTGVNVTPDTESPFMFSRCELTDDDSVVTPTSWLGEIQAAITEVVVMGAMPTVCQSPLAPLKVHERSKKNLVHGIQLGEPIVNTAPMFDVIHNGILANFIFRYRPLDILQADGIAPRVPPNALHEIAASYYPNTVPHPRLWKSSVGGTSTQNNVHGSPRGQYHSTPAQNEASAANREEERIEALEAEIRRLKANQPRSRRRYKPEPVNMQVQREVKREDLT